MGAFEYTALDTRRALAQGRHRRRHRAPRALAAARKATAAGNDRGGRGRGVPQETRRADSALRRGVSAADLSLLTRQLSTLVRAGLPLEEALLAVSEQTERPRVQSIVLGVRAKVVEGHTLADGLDEFPSVFPEIYRATVAAGEHSGHLDAVLERLADYTESREQMRQKVHGRDALSDRAHHHVLCDRVDPADLRRAQGRGGVRGQSRQAAARDAGAGGGQRLSAQLRHLADSGHRRGLRSWSGARCGSARRAGDFTARCCACRSSGASCAASIRRASPARSAS